MDRASYTNHAKAWEFVEEYASARQDGLVDGLVATARDQALATGFPESSAMQASLLRLLVRLTSSTSVISVGTGNLVEVAALVDGLAGHGQLTAVDSSAPGAEAVKALVHTVAEASETSLRVVHARPGSFLPRLNAHDYDLIVVSGEVQNYLDTLDQSPRLLSEHGTIVFTDMLAYGSDLDRGVFNPADRDPTTVAMRDLLNRIADDDRLDHALLPVGTGVCIAVNCANGPSPHEPLPPHHR